MDRVLPDMDTLIAAVEDSMFGLGNPGFCLHCGAEASGVEPDAEGYECEACGEPQVFGAERLMWELA